MEERWDLERGDIRTVMGHPLPGEKRGRNFQLREEKWDSGRRSRRRLKRSSGAPSHPLPGEKRGRKFLSWEERWDPGRSQRRLKCSSGAAIGPSCCLPSPRRKSSRRLELEGRRERG
jgi:hypothetical protein